MPSTVVSNSLFPKVMYRYGEMLDSKNYNALVNCKSISEVVEYLKLNTAYKKVFENNASKVVANERKAIENLLHKTFFDSSISLCRYGRLSDEGFFNTFIIEADINQILRCIRLFKSENSDFFSKDMPEYLADYTFIKDLISLATVRDFDSLLNVLEGSPYYDVLLPFKETFNSNDNEGIVYIEAALNKYKTDYIMKSFKNSKSKKKKLVLKAVSYRLDMDFISTLCRIRKSWSAHNNIINYNAVLNTDITNFSQKQIEAFMKADSTEKIAEILQTTIYKKDFKHIENDDFFEKTANEILYNKYKYLLRFSNDSDTLVYSYIFLLNIEIQNLIKITEGIRYKLLPNDITDLLVGIQKV